MFRFSHFLTHFLNFTHNFIFVHRFLHRFHNFWHFSRYFHNMLQILTHFDILHIFIFFPPVFPQKFRFYKFHSFTTFHPILYCSHICCFLPQSRILVYMHQRSMVPHHGSTNMKKMHAAIMKECARKGYRDGWTDPFLYSHIPLRRSREL